MHKADRNQSKAASSPPPKPLTQEAKQRTEEVKATVNREADETAHQLEASVAKTKSGVADRGDKIAGAVRRLAEELTQDDEAWLGDVASSAATNIGRVSKHLRSQSIEELTNEVRGFSNHPVAFLGGAFALGLIAGRFLKSSSPESNLGSDTGQFSRAGRHASS